MAACRTHTHSEVCTHVRRLAAVPAPLAFRKLEHIVAAGGGAAVEKELGRWRAVPDVQQARQHCCTLTPKPSGRAFQNASINSFLAATFHAATFHAAASSSGTRHAPELQPVLSAHLGPTSEVSRQLPLHR